MLKSLAILSDTNARTIMEIRKKSHIPLCDQQGYYLQVSQRLY